MEKKLKKLTLLLAAMSLVSIVCSTRAEADIRIFFTANESGFSLFYHVPLLATGFLNLKNDGQPKNINIALFFFRLAQIKLSITDITTTETAKTVGLHYALTGSIPSIPSAEGDFKVPFCSAGADVGFFKFFGFPVLAEHDMKAFLLVKKNKTKYDIHLHTDNNTVTADWQGTATEAANIVNEKITIKAFGDQPLDAQFTFDYSTAFIAQCEYKISMTMPSFTPGKTDTSTPMELFKGTIPLPYGRYKVWVDAK